MMGVSAFSSAANIAYFALPDDSNSPASVFFACSPFLAHATFSTILGKKLGHVILKSAYFSHQSPCCPRKKEQSLHLFLIIMTYYIIN